MPTYAYRCTSCGHSFDIQQSFQDASLTVCPECGGSLRKVFGNLGVTFHGSGFYRTDSRAGGGSKEGTTNSGSDSSSGGSSGSGSSNGSPGSGNSSSSSSTSSSTSGSNSSGSSGSTSSSSGSSSSK